ncbi:hypothetical protein [Streptomyces sp. AHA2]|uniref:hypothetical protein n=1 Tax=Streptomyces sp. AHA2 TaxID=3064526 RepID=UPI002FE099F8
MDEGRDTQPAADRRPTPPIAAAASGLSAVQKAWKRYVDHSLYECDTCRRVDGSPCQTAEQLHGRFKVLADEAMDQVRGARSSGHNITAR